MMKEQKQLREKLGDREAVIAHQESELKELKRQNKKLQMSSNKAKLLIMADDHRDMDTPSSEDTSPKSSFSNKSILANKLVSALGDNLVSTVQLPEIPPRPIKAAAEGAIKPPVPSRAGVNRKLQQGPRPPPVPPARTSSMSTSQKSYDDSGREESDDNAGDTINNVSTESLVKSDDGFCSSHEESGRLRLAPASAPPRSGSGLSSSSSSASDSNVPAIRQLTNHRAVQRPSDIKFRSKLRSATIPPSPTSLASNLSVLQEHQVSSPGDGTTVTYWTEPYL